MKNLLLPLFVAISSVCAFAQSPTMDFETWTGADPDGWVSGNAFMLFGNTQSVFKETTPANVHGGINAMKIVSVTLTNNPDPTTIPNPVGAAFPGIVSLSPLGLKDGFQYTNRPATVDFWYQYVPSGGDSASCYLQLSKWTTKRDTIAEGGVVIKTAASVYTLSTINLIYDPAFTNMLPDTMRIYFSATCYGPPLTCGTAGSTLWIDDVTFSGGTGINDRPVSNDVIIFPNPASEYVTIAADINEAHFVVTYDVTGRMITSASFTQSMDEINKKESTIQTSYFSAGLYSYAIFNETGNILRNGKFSIVR